MDLGNWRVDFGYMKVEGVGCEAMWKTFAQNGKKKKEAAERSGTCITLFEEEKVYIGVRMSEIVALLK